MRVLLDENLDRRLRASLTGHEVFTVGYKRWTGLQNGRLLDAAEKDGLDVLLTGDQTLQYEQNLARRKLAIVVLTSVEWRISAIPGSFQKVDCGTFSRKKSREQ